MFNHFYRLSITLFWILPFFKFNINTDCNFSASITYFPWADDRPRLRSNLPSAMLFINLWPWTKGILFLPILGKWKRKNNNRLPLLLESAHCGCVQDSNWFISFPIGFCLRSTARIYSHKGAPG